MHPSQKSVFVAPTYCLCVLDTLCEYIDYITEFTYLQKALQSGLRTFEQKDTDTEC